MANRLNPVELIIFVVVAAGFGFSARQVFEEKPLDRVAMLSPMASNPISSAGRAPASTEPLLGSVDFTCQKDGEASVRASRIRISGPICGMEAGARIASTSVLNSANQFRATVFTDLGSRRFSTDYIPLNSDKNRIQVEFKFADGRQLSRELVLHKE